MTKTGTENPSTEKIITARSIHGPAFDAASTPIGIAVSTETKRVETARVTVGSTRCMIKVETGRLVKIDMPRSPCSKCHTQPPNWR